MSKTRWWNPQRFRRNALSSGVQFERLVLGMENAYIGHFPGLTVQECVLDAMRHQPEKWDARKPPTLAAGRMFDAVTKNLPEELRPLLRMYSGVARFIDYQYGIDCFFCLDDNPEIFIGIDLTTKSEVTKEELHNALMTLQVRRCFILSKGDYAYDVIGLYCARKLIKKWNEYEAARAAKESAACGPSLQVSNPLFHYGGEFRLGRKQTQEV